MFSFNSFEFRAQFAKYEFYHLIKIDCLNFKLNIPNSFVPHIVCDILNKDNVKNVFFSTKASIS